jgi:hypothetical protein
VNATSHEHIRGHQPPVVSPTLSRPTEDLTRRGLEREFVSSFSSDISDLCSAELSPASDHQQWALPGDGGSGGHFPLSPGQPPIYDDVTSPGRRRMSFTRFCTLRWQTGLTDTHSASAK